MKLIDIIIFVTFILLMGFCLYKAAAQGINKCKTYKNTVVYRECLGI